MATETATRTTPGEVPGPPPRHPRYPLSEGARALSVVAVMLCHAWLFTGGFGGFTGSLPNRLMVRLDGAVAIFFFLSAFLLYRPMIAHRAGGPPSPGVADYARRRILRIYPAYWVALTVLAIVPGLVGVFSDHWFAFYSLGFYLDLANASKACIGEPGYRCGLPQSWTLTVDMTFYLILPLYLAVTSLLARRRGLASWVRLELGLLALLCAASVVIGAFDNDVRQAFLFRFSFAGHFFWLGLGLAAAVISVAAENRREALPGALRWAAEHPGACWAAAGAIWLIEVLTLFPAPFTVAPVGPGGYIAMQLLPGVVGALLLIPVCFADPNKGVPARSLGNPVVMWVGMISYSLYLWSTTITVDVGVAGAEKGFLVTTVLTFLIAIPVAAASFYLIERPTMSLKYRSPLTALRERRRRVRTQA
ncbi:MAG TPA: acyltransferase [Solirubrobacterales bacterium]|nr:acyltransferase [Solirubrobacterales bacterium]